MSLNRTRMGLTACLLACLLATPIFASDPLEDMQLFAPPDEPGFGGGVRANEGWFATADWIHWSVSAPEVTQVGYPNLTRNVFFSPQAAIVDPAPGLSFVESNTVNTDFIQAWYGDGQRYELGWIEEHEGFVVGGFHFSEPCGQNKTRDFQDAHVVFNTPPFGQPPFLGAPQPDLLQGYVDNGLTTIRDLPTIFPDLKLSDSVQLWRVNADYIYRMHPGKHGGMFEWYFGGSFMQFYEMFQFDSWGGILDDTYVYTWGENNIVGPEVKLRWFKNFDRINFDAQGGFMAGYNRQNLHQRGHIAENLDGNRGTVGFPLYLTPTNFESKAFLDEFSQVVDFKVNVSYAVTRAISVRVGWTGMWMNNIARPVDMVNYTLGTGNGQTMGIVTANNTQNVFVQGWNIGVELNR